MKRKSDDIKDLDKDVFFTTREIYDRYMKNNIQSIATAYVSKKIDKKTNKKIIKPLHFIDAAPINVAKRMERNQKEQFLNDLSVSKRQQIISFTEKEMDEFEQYYKNFKKDLPKGLDRLTYKYRITGTGRKIYFKIILHY